MLFIFVLPTMWLIGRRPPLARRQTDPIPSLADPDFGKISFVGDEIGFWQTHDTIEDQENRARYGFSSIPGDHEGPFPKSRAFLLQKKKELPELWRICRSTLEEVCERWSFKGLRKPVMDQFVLTSIGIDEDFESSGVLEVGFESKGDFWVYALMTIQDGKVVSHVCDT